MVEKTAKLLGWVWRVMQIEAGMGGKRAVAAILAVRSEDKRSQLAR